MSKVIVAKTRMRKMPKTCKTCSIARRDWWAEELYCGANNRVCPMDNTANGRLAYVKPSWCPLVEIER